MKHSVLLYQLNVVLTFVSSVGCWYSWQQLRQRMEQIVQSEVRRAAAGEKKQNTWLCFNLTVQQLNLFRPVEVQLLQVIFQMRINEDV